MVKRLHFPNPSHNPNPSPNPNPGSDLTSAGTKLIEASGKMMVLDKLLARIKVGQGTGHWTGLHGLDRITGQVCMKISVGDKGIKAGQGSSDRARGPWGSAWGHWTGLHGLDRTTGLGAGVQAGVRIKSML